jgi:hypothetical protein
MTARSKYLRSFACLGAFLSVAIFFWFGHSTPQPDLRALFADMSIGMPEYEKIQEFTRPADAIKGDFFTLVFSQSEAQFHRFVANTGVSATAILSSSGVSITAPSKADPKFPWLLTLRAEVTNAPNKIYRVHIEGRQPYN